MADAVRWSIKNTRKELARLMDEASAFLKSRPVSSDVLYKVNLALEEILTNIIKYAFSDSRVHTVDVELAVTETKILIQFVDDGQEFDPFSCQLPRLGESVLEREVGGLGIHLVRQVADVMQYRRVGRHNVLTIEVNLGA